MNCPAATHGRETDYINHGCICPEARNAHRVRRKARALHMLERGPMLQDGTSTALRLRALNAIGHSSRDIASHSFLSWEHLAKLRTDAMRRQVTPRVAAEVVRLYQLLSETPGTNNRARAQARFNGYLDPTALEAVDDSPAIDMVAIGRALDGERVELTSDEKDRAVLIGHERGLTPNQIADALHMNGGRVKLIIGGVPRKKRGPARKAA